MRKYYKNIKTGLYHYPNGDSGTMCGVRNLSPKIWVVKEFESGAEDPKGMLCSSCQQKLKFAMRTGRIHA